MNIFLTLKVDCESGKQWRFSEIKQFTETCVNRLKEIGITSNSRLALVTSTTAQTIFIHLASAIIGNIVVCINGYSSIDEIWHQVDLSESTHCITEPQFMSKIDEVRRKAVMRGGGRIKITKTIEEALGQEKLNIKTLTKKESKYSVLSKEESQALLIENVGNNHTVSTPTSDKPEDDKESVEIDVSNISVDEQEKQTLFIFYSSGTTGLPKAVEITHQSLIINLMQISLPIYSTLSVKDKFLLPLSITHLYGLISAYYSLINGSELYFLSKYSTKSLLNAINEYKVCIQLDLHIFF